MSSAGTLDAITWNAVGRYQRLGNHERGKEGGGGLNPPPPTTAAPLSPYRASWTTTWEEMELLHGAATQKLYLPLPHGLRPFPCHGTPPAIEGCPDVPDGNEMAERVMEEEWWRVARRLRPFPHPRRISLARTTPRQRTSKEKDGTQGKKNRHSTPPSEVEEEEKGGHMEGRVVPPPLLRLLDSVYVYHEYLAKYPSLSYIILPAMVELMEQAVQEMTQLILEGRGASSGGGFPRITPVHLSLAAQAFAVLADVLPPLQCRLLRLLNLECLLSSSVSSSTPFHSLFRRAATPSFFADESGRLWPVYWEDPTASSAEEEKEKETSFASFSEKKGKGSARPRVAVPPPTSTPSLPREVSMTLSYATDGLSRLAVLCERRWKDCFAMMIRVIRSRLRVPDALLVGVEKKDRLEKPSEAQRGSGRGGPSSPSPEDRASVGTNRMTNAAKSSNNSSARALVFHSPVKPTRTVGGVGGGAPTTAVVRAQVVGGPPPPPPTTLSVSSIAKRWREVGHAWILHMLKEVAHLLRLVRPLLCGALEVEMLMAPLMGEMGRLIRAVVGRAGSAGGGGGDGGVVALAGRGVGGKNKGNDSVPPPPPSSATAAAEKQRATLTPSSASLERGKGTSSPSVRPRTVVVLVEEEEDKGGTPTKDEKQLHIEDEEKENVEEMRRDILLFKVNADKLGYDVLRCASCIFSAVDVLHLHLLLSLSASTESDPAAHPHTEKGGNGEDPSRDGGASTASSLMVPHKAAAIPSVAVTVLPLCTATNVDPPMAKGEAPLQKMSPMCCPHYPVRVETRAVSDPAAGSSPSVARLLSLIQADERRHTDREDAEEEEEKGEAPRKEKEEEEEEGACASLLAPCSTQEEVFQYLCSTGDGK